MTDATAQLYDFLVIGAILFVLGMTGLLARRNMIVMFLCVEMMLQGVSLSLVAWGGYHGNWGGQVLVVFMIAVAACEAAIGLALILMLFHRSGTLDITFWQETREEGQSAYVDSQVPEEREEDRVWPRLTTAGLQPTIDEEAQQHRTRV